MFFFFYHQFDAKHVISAALLFSLSFLFPFLSDAPKILGPVAVYTWEGNPANISCEILAHPSDVSIMWLRDGLQLPNANSTNIRFYTTPTASYLQVKSLSPLQQAAFSLKTYNKCTNQWWSWWRFLIDGVTD